MNYLKPLSLALLLICTTNVRADGERIALCIGINKYDSKELKNLNYSENDIIDLASLLRDAGYKVVLMTTMTGKLDPRLLPTKENIEAQILATLEKRKRGDLILLALAGHGIAFDNDPDAYFCPANADPLEDKKNTLLSINQVYTKLGLCEAGSKLLIADCSRGATSQTRKSMPDDILFRLPPRGVTVLYASNLNEQSYEFAELKHGIFFHYFIEGLKGKAGETRESLKFDDLVTYIKKEMPTAVQLLAGKEKNQAMITKSFSQVSTPLWLFTPGDRKIFEDTQVLHHWRMTKGSAGYFALYAPKRVADWKVAAEHGSVWGMILYGNCLERGLSVEQDRIKAVEWYRRAVDSGEPYAMICLGYCYMKGLGIVSDKQQSAKWFRKAAELGDTEGMGCLSICFLGGIGVVKDRTKAIEWSSQAIELGNGNSMYNLGLCYLDSGEVKDAAKAVGLLRKASEQENVEAISLLGFCFLRGIGVEIDDSKAFELYRKSAELGHPAGMNGLGLCYWKGYGTMRDDSKAFEWFQRAAELDEPEAINNLGACYRDGIGITADSRKAVELFRKASEKGVAVAMRCLAGCYYDGIGVEANIAKAFELYRQAAELGELAAMHSLGLCYLNGKGVMKDPTKAFHWFQKSAGKGNDESMALLGACYWQGAGVAKDEKKAFEWFRKSADLGNEKAKKILKELGRE